MWFLFVLACLACLYFEYLQMRDMSGSNWDMKRLWRIRWEDMFVGRRPWWSKLNHFYTAFTVILLFTKYYSFGWYFLCAMLLRSFYYFPCYFTADMPGIDATSFSWVFDRLKDAKRGVNLAVLDSAISSAILVVILFSELFY